MVRPSLLAAVVFIAVPQAHASEPCATVAAQAVTVAPFAIPVAVPVAVVQQPTLFYGYGRYVPATTVDPAANAARPTNTAPAVADAPTVSIGALLKKHCAECHQGATARGGLQLFAADGSPLALLPRQALAEACAPADGAAPTMPPPGRAPLTPEEQALVRRWAVPPKTLRY